MKKPTVLVAAGGGSRRALKRALAGYPQLRADDSAAVLDRLAEDPSPLVLVWELQADGEFDAAALRAARAIRPRLPTLVLVGGWTPRRAAREVRALAARARAEKPRASGAVLRYALRRLAEARAAFAHLPVAATLTDGDGRVLAVNREAERLSERLVGRPGALTCRDFWHCRTHRLHCPLRRAFETGRPVYHARMRTEGPDGPRTVIERVSTWDEPGLGRRAVVVTGPATSFFRRMRRLRLEATTDFLTSVLNRRRFDALTARAERGERRRGRRNAFLMLDIDGFKGINDRWGHAAGDRVLRRLGLLLSAHIRRGDLVGRVGGDEFAIFCPDTTPARAQGLVKRLQRAIAEDNRRREREPALSVQFGLACSDARRRGGLRERADAQLYRRKRALAPAPPDAVRPDDLI